MLDLFEQQPAPRTFRWRGFILREEIEHPLRAGEDIVVDRRVFLERKHLRHVADHEIAPQIDFPGVRRHIAGRDLEKSRFPGAIATDQADALALQNRD